MNWIIGPRRRGGEKWEGDEIHSCGVPLMPISLHARRLVTCVIVRLRNLAGDERCAARIERYLERSGPGEMAEPIGAGGGEAGARIRQALAHMPPLTRAVLAVVVGRRMSVTQVSRRFGISEARVCWHFRRAILIVAECREIR